MISLAKMKETHFNMTRFIHETKNQRSQDKVPHQASRQIYFILSFHPTKIKISFIPTIY